MYIWGHPCGGKILIFVSVLSISVPHIPPTDNILNFKNISPASCISLQKIQVGESWYCFKLHTSRQLDFDMVVKQMLYDIPTDTTYESFALQFQLPNFQENINIVYFLQCSHSHFRSCLGELEQPFHNWQTEWLWPKSYLQFNRLISTNYSNENLTLFASQ
jgi:hypothetical protein